MASSPTLQDLQEDIDLYEGLYNSCRNEPGMEDDQEEYKRKLADLRARIDRMGRMWSGEGGRPHTEQSGHVSKSSATTNSTPDNSTVLTSKQYLKLPSRKRNRDEFGDDMDTNSLHRIKSRRSTPADSPAVSAVDSVDSDYFDDPELGNLLGTSWQDAVRSNKEFLKQQEAKRRQQEEDERMARLLQEEFDNSRHNPSLPTFGRATSTQFSTQATFQPNGSFSKPPPSQTLNQEYPTFKPEYRDQREDSPTTIGSSDDDFTVLSPAEWTQRYPTTTPGPSRTLPQTFGHSLYIPGSYPAPQPAFTSMPGSSVYGRTSHQPVQNASLLGRLPSLGALPGLANLGSLANPFDLDTLGSFPFSLTGGLNGLPAERPWETVDPQQTQEEIRQLLHNIRPDEEIDPSEASENQPEGLKAKLMPHQVKGLAWMKKMEEGSNKGGILADDMGLGKTIQSIALMLSRPSGSTKRPTLVVTPVALMDQWRREILKVVRGNAALSVLLLHGPHAHTPWARVKHYDVVLTSYGTLSSELRRKLNWEEKLKLNPDAKKSKKDEFPVLDDKAFFHRIFLDEAQNVKNRATKTAMAACRVNAEFRWCLSGTPMQNSVEEIYSLIKFLRIRPYCDWEKFAKDISRPLKARYEMAQKRAMEKLQTLLKAILLRRTKKSQIDGEPILQLPEKHTVETRAIFNQDQLDFYKALETQSQIQFNKFVKNGTVGRNYSRALVLLLRLRQCCCSPQLVTNSADFITDSGVEGIDLVANAKELPTDAVARIREQEDMECPICMDAVENPIIFNPCGHALCHDCFSRMADDVRVETADNVKCPHCRAKIDTKKITDFASFNDVYGNGPRASDLDVEEDAQEETDEDSSDDEVEGDGDDNGDDLKDFIINDDVSVEPDSESEDEDDLDRVKKPKKAAQCSKLKLKCTNEVTGRKKLRRKSKGKKKEEHKSLADLRKEGLKSRAAKKKYLNQLSKIYEPCAKIDKTLELLNEIHNRGLGEKTIVFSSFTSFLDLVEVPLHKDENLSNYTRYDGSMTPKDRNEAVLRFTDDPHCRVMLVSLKAGNAGLNLTVANHVLLLDPFWNPFVEHQAADRCHRIGQKREVTVHRVLIGEEGVDHAAESARVFTVEDRILELQEKKRKLVESALDENAASGISRLGVRELGYLFGVSEMPRQGGQ